MFRSLGLLSVLLALLIVGLLVKKQLRPDAPTTAPVAGEIVIDRSAPMSPAQGHQIQQQVREALDAAARARPMPEDLE